MTRLVIRFRPARTNQKANAAQDEHDRRRFWNGYRERSRAVLGGRGRWTLPPVARRIGVETAIDALNALAIDVARNIDGRIEGERVAPTNGVDNGIGRIDEHGL